MNVAPSLLNFFAVQIALPLSRRRLLRGRYIHVPGLAVGLAAAYLIGAALGHRCRDRIREVVKTFALEPESASEVDRLYAYLADRANERLSLMRRAIGGDPPSFLDLIVWTTKESLVGMGRLGRFLPIATPGEWVDPEEKAARARIVLENRAVEPSELFFNQSKVRLDPLLVAAFVGPFVGEGIAFGVDHGDIAMAMAGNDVDVSLADWTRARQNGLDVPGDPPVKGVRQLQEMAEFEYDFFRRLRSSDPTGRVWGGSSRLFRGEYRAWTGRALGMRALLFYRFHLAERLAQVLGGSTHS